MSSTGGSFSHASFHVGSDWMTRCSTYSDTTPILSIDAGDSSVSVTIAGRKATEAAVKFTQALLRDVQEFAAEVERMHAASLAADFGEPAEQAA
jgi:hypothetical protein